MAENKTNERQPNGWKVDSMKTFKTLSNDLYAVKNAGYELDFGKEYETDFPTEWSENRKSDEIDSFYDLDNAELCEDKNGELYAVEKAFIDGEFKPIIWQRLKVMY